VALRLTFGARPATRLHPQGEKPADLCRFRAPTKYELAINLKTAKRAPCHCKLGSSVVLDRTDRRGLGAMAEPTIGNAGAYAVPCHEL
jgi:hypothetical protein